MRIVAPGEREILGDAPDRGVAVLSDVPGVHATWARFGAGREGASLHVHREHTDYFYVLEGELEIRLGPEGEPHRLETGQLAIAPALVIHGFGNTSDAEARYLNFHIPGSGFIDFMRGIRDGVSRAYDQHEPPADGGRDPEDAYLGVPRDPFSLVELEPGASLGPQGGAARAAFVLAGDLGEAAPGSWIQFEDEAEAIAARSASSLLVLDA